VYLPCSALCRRRTCALTLYCKVLHDYDHGAPSIANFRFGSFGLRTVVLAFSRKARRARGPAMARLEPALQGRVSARGSVHSTVSVGRMGKGPRTGAEGFSSSRPFY